VKGQFSLGGHRCRRDGLHLGGLHLRERGRLQDERRRGRDLGHGQGRLPLERRHHLHQGQGQAAGERSAADPAQGRLRQTTPKWRGNLAAGWADSHWTVDGFIHYVSKYDSYNGNVLEAAPDYASVAARVAYQMPAGIVVALNGQNLLHDRQSQAKGVSGLQAERRIQFP
jgi:outer membrane receptor protein involved in Fe transport